MKKIFNSTIALVLLGIGGAVQALPAHAPYPPMEQNQTADPAVVLQQGLDQLLTFLRTSGEAGGMEISAFLENSVVPMFDFNYMAQWVGGRHFSAMTPEQRFNLANSLKHKLLSTMSQKLSGYNKQSLRILRPRRMSVNEAKIGVMIQNPNGYATRVDFRLYLGQDGWKIFDIAANGGSILNHYRSDFAHKREATR